MAHKVPRRGRREANRPVCSKNFVWSVVCKTLEREGVSFGAGGKSFEERCWRLFRLFQFLIPAAVVATGLPVSLYGVGSYKLSETAAGHKFRHSFSKRILGLVVRRMGIPQVMQSRRVMLDRFWRALDLFMVEDRGGGPLLLANYLDLDFDD
jgi:hypothetical protein